MAVLVAGGLILLAADYYGLIGGSGEEYFKVAPKGKSLYDLQFSGTTLAGNLFSTADKRGKVLLVNFFATWCPPCIDETPHLVALYDEFKDRGLEMVMVTDEPARKVTTFARFNQISYAIVPNGEQVRKKVPGFKGLPTTVILDKEGKVRYQIVGPQVKRMKEAVVELLAE
ncbi:MAG: redoxin domain-containing protein [Anaerolineaceae bacterium]|nr:redoxin domain-containing protein [Anaerolineaceae bacterium]